MSNPTTFIVYNVVKGKNGKDDFVSRIGYAFKYTTADGREGFNIPNLNLKICEPKDEAELNEIPSTSEAEKGEQIS